MRESKLLLWAVALCIGLNLTSNWTIVGQNIGQKPVKFRILRGFRFGTVFALEGHLKQILKGLCCHGE